MTTTLLLLVLLGLSAVYSGSETGIYSLSRIRLDVDARGGHRMAKLLGRLVERDTRLLITLLIGNNLVLELATHIAHGEVAGWRILPPWGRELFVTLVLTPFVFLFGELLPKDVFRRRPHALLYKCTPLLAMSRLAYLPVALPLQWLSTLLERALGLHGHDLARALGREEVLEVLRQGAREGKLHAHAEALARNVLVLRQTPVESVMLPWSETQTADLDLPPDRVREDVGRSECTRLPALRRDRGGNVGVVGYLHQLDLLAAPGVDPGDLLRPLPALDAALPVDKALNTMRLTGQRIALVGTPEAPRGLVSVIDLIGTISGGPAA